MHTAIFGMMRQGKTSVALGLVPELKRARKPVAVLTVAMPDGRLKDGERWQRAGADLVTADKAKFLRALTAPKTWGAHGFVDEANKTVGWHDEEMEQLATAASINATTLYFLAVRANTFNKTVREQCVRLFMFRMGIDDASDLAKQFACPELRRGPELDKGQYFYCTTARGSLRFGDLGLR